MQKDKDKLLPMLLKNNPYTFISNGYTIRYKNYDKIVFNSDYYTFLLE